MEPALIEELTDSNIPVVFYDVGAPRQNITNIRVNYRRGIDKVIDYLYSLGHRKLGFVGHHAMLGPINERVKPVLDAVARYPGLEVRTAADADTLDGGRLAARALLASGEQPTAIVCVNDIMAVGALARVARARHPRPAGCLGHRLRQREAFRILLPGAYHGAHSTRYNRASDLRIAAFQIR